MHKTRPLRARLSYGEPVPGDAEFVATRATWRSDLAADEELRRKAVALQLGADKHHYTYTWEWLGVPIIRLPDDIVVLQQIFWAYRPGRVVETGVARGGSILLDASLMRLCGDDPAVLGIDVEIFDHTLTALCRHPLAAGVELVEADSTSPEAERAVRTFLAGSERAVLILDSNHSHTHVLSELRLLAPLLPIDGLVLVADTIIQEFPQGYFANRPWDRENNPATAIRQFLTERSDFQLAKEWTRRALVSEFRDGVLMRVR